MIERIKEEKTVIVTAGIIKRKNRILIGKRPDGASLGGYWEFPGGKPENGEDPRSALRRELHEELAVDSNIGRPYEITQHNYDFGSILLLFFEAEIIGEPKSIYHEEIRWVGNEELQSLEFLPADKGVVSRLITELT